MHLKIKKTKHPILEEIKQNLKKRTIEKYNHHTYLVHEDNNGSS